MTNRRPASADFSGIYSPDAAAHRLRQAALDVDRVVIACGWLSDEDRGALQDAYTIITTTAAQLDPAGAGPDERVITAIMSRLE